MPMILNLSGYESVNNYDLELIVSTPSDAEEPYTDTVIGYDILILFVLAMVFGAVVGKGFFR